MTFLEGFDGVEPHGISLRTPHVSVLGRQEEVDMTVVGDVLDAAGTESGSGIVSSVVTGSEAENETVDDVSAAAEAQSDALKRSRSVEVDEALKECHRPDETEIIIQALTEKFRQLMQAPPPDTPEPLVGGLWTLPSVPKHDLRNLWLVEEKQVTIRDEHEWNSDAKFLRLPNYIIKGSGLAISSQTNDLVLFNRMACQQQVKFIQESVIANGKEGFIYGQPGTGKSTITFFACCLLRHDYDIVWIHMGTDEFLAEIVTIQGNVLRKVKGPQKKLLLDVTLKKMDGKNQRTPKTLLVLDDFNFNNPEAARVRYEGGLWRKNDCVNRRFITVCSMGTFGKGEKTIGKHVARHAVGSWSIDEYMEAIKSDIMWESVRHGFSGDIKADLEKREVLVKSKFYYAGTSTQFMFGMSIEEVKDAITRAVRDSILSNCFKHVLISFIHDLQDEISRGGFVSQHAARAFGATSTADAIRALSNQCVLLENSKARGWMFEAFFLASAAQSSDMVVRTSTALPIIWSCSKHASSRVAIFDPKDRLPFNTWLYSDSPQQAGFLAITLLSTGTIRFILTTVARQHDIQMGALANLVKQIQEMGHVVDEAEVFIVVPEDSFAKNFRITILHGWETFVELFDSWPNTLEDVERKVQTVMIAF